MLSQEFLASVSYFLINGPYVSKSIYNYTYYYNMQISTQLPDGIQAVLKLNGAIVAILNGIVSNLTLEQAEIVFIDSSNNSYQFNEVEIYTTYKNNLLVKVSKFIFNTLYSKSSDEVTYITYILTINNSSSTVINYAVMLLLVPNAFLTSNTTIQIPYGVSSVAVSNVQGQVQIQAYQIIANGFNIIVNVNTTGGNKPVFTVYESVLEVTPTQIINQQVLSSKSSLTTTQLFSVPLNVSLPSTSSPFLYPVAITFKWVT